MFLKVVCSNLIPKFFTLCCYKNCNICLKNRPGWPIFKKTFLNHFYHSKGLHNQTRNLNIDLL